MCVKVQTLTHMVSHITISKSGRACMKHGHHFGFEETLFDFVNKVIYLIKTLLRGGGHITETDIAVGERAGA